jgi:hypothetical protein
MEINENVESNEAEIGSERLFEEPALNPAFRQQGQPTNGFGTRAQVGESFPLNGPGTDVIILKIFSLKNLAKKRRFS